MKKKFLLCIVVLAVSVILLAGVAFSQPIRDPEIKNRIAESQKKIDEGISDRSLTRQESETLQSKLDRIKNEEARLKADRLLTPRERERLHRELDMLGDEIVKLRHNAEVAPPPPPPAPPKAAEINERISELQRRIDAGIADRSLTRHEAAKLQTKLEKIKTEEAILRIDGRLSPKEKERLNKELDNLSEEIFKKRHNPAGR